MQHKHLAWSEFLSEGYCSVGAQAKLLECQIIRCCRAQETQPHAQELNEKESMREKDLPMPETTWGHVMRSDHTLHSSIFPSFDFYNSRVEEEPRSTPSLPTHRQRDHNVRKR